MREGLLCFVLGETGSGGLGQGARAGNGWGQLAFPEKPESEKGEKCSVRRRWTRVALD